jgi:hypothetical protein
MVNLTNVKFVIALGVCLTITLAMAQATSYYVTGTVSGYVSGSSSPIHIYNNGTAEQTITSNGVFSFLITGSGNVAYNVTVDNNASQSCTVMNGTGSVANDATTAPPPIRPTVWISCEPAHGVPPSPSWIPLAQKAKGSLGTMLLLSDGSVIVNDSNGSNPTERTTWFRLSPDSTGHYVHGTWGASQQYPAIPNSLCPHDLFASRVLRDGRVFVGGGEDPNDSGLPGCSQPGQVGTGVDTEIYDPVKNRWTAADPPISLIDPKEQPALNPAGCTFSLGATDSGQAFLDMISELLPDGSVLMAPVCPRNCGDTLIFNPASFSATTPGSGWVVPAATLANIGTTGYSCSQQEATWVELQDGSILTADPPANRGMNQTSERYIPTMHAWVNDAALGFALFDAFFGWSGGGEEGPAFLLPSGKAIFVGGASVMGTYSPAATSASGLPTAATWAQQDIAPNSPQTGGAPLAADDAPGAMMATGKILLALNYAPTSVNPVPSPVLFFEYDPVQGSFTEVAGPGDPLAPSPWADCYPTTMLDLPDGTVLMAGGCGDHTQAYVYQPSGPPIAQGTPTIASVTANSDGSYHLVGTGLNGISEGASFGDDAQMATNYPLVRLTQGLSVAYARTYNWSETGLIPGAAGSVDFSLPAGLGQGYHSLQVVVNGNASKIIAFNVSPPPPPPVNCRALINSLGQFALYRLGATPAMRQTFERELLQCLISKQIDQATYNSALKELENTRPPSPSLPPK